LLRRWRRWRSVLPPQTPNRSSCSKAHDPYDRALSHLVGELSTRCDEFRVRWAAHDVRIHATGTKRLHHPLVGDLDLAYESLTLPDHGQSLLVCVAEPGSPSHDALSMLASYVPAT